jgi:tetratricopeptide (TPR) repeat protein
MANISGSDLAALEYEFATKPTSEAFIPLAEAYLGMGRFVEAMVVCKKGIKAHPDLPVGRLIMARIYADQAKHQKSIEELNKLLKLVPEHAEAHSLLGKIYIKIGREEEGITLLKKALDADPQLEQARDELLKIGVDYQPKQAVPEAPVQAPTPAPAATPTPTAAAPTPSAASAPTTAPTTPPAAPSAPTAATPQTPAPAPAAAPAPVAAQPARKRIADLYQEMDSAQNEKSKSGTFKKTIVVFAALLAGFVIYIIYTWQAGLTQEEINQHLKEGKVQFNQASYGSYKKALEHYKAIYALDKENPEALSRAAFISAVLVGQFGEGQALLQESAKFVAEAKIYEQDNAMLAAAEAYSMLHGNGTSSDALKILETAVKKIPESPIINTALGYVHLNKGNLSEARDFFLKGASQSDKSAFIGLGLYAIRRSMYREGGQAFSRALQTDKDYVPAILKKSLLTLIWKNSPQSINEVSANLENFDKNLIEDASEKEKSEAEFIKAVLQLRNRKTRKAGKKQVQELLKKNADNSLFHFVVARELRRLGGKKRLEEAKKTIGKALRLDSTRPDFVLEEASILLTMKDFEGARSRAMRVQEMDTESGLSAMLIGDAYLGEKNYSKAQQYYTEAKKFDDVEARSHFKLGNLYLNQPQADTDRAQASLELAVSGLTTTGETRLAAEACVLLSKIYAQKNLTKKFAGVLKRARSIDPSYAPPYCMLAANIDISSKDGREAAKENCSQCIKLDASGKYSKGCREILKRIGR